MTAHTPGPWTYEVHELSEGYSGIVYDANGYRVGTDHLTEANARLIAAAPDMLAALQQLYAQLEPSLKGVGEFEPLGMAANAARAAIDKAEGTT